MKQGKTLIELATVITQQSLHKKDYVADTRSLALTEDLSLKLSNGHTNVFAVSDHTHTQIANRLQIPMDYYRRMMKENGRLLTQNVNSWFQVKPERRMVRTLEGRARAFLSDSYRRLDYEDMLEAVLPVILHEMPGAKIESCEVTESKLYFKVVNQRLELEVKKGDPVQAGFVLSNSEIGKGSVNIQPMIYRLACLNGMISTKFSHRKYHVGKQVDATETLELFRDETLQADDNAFWLKVQDIVRAAIDEAKFALIVNEFREATEKKIEGNPVQTVELVSKQFSFNEGEKGGVLRHLIEGADLSAYGLMNAITRMAQDVPDYDRSTEIERLGTHVIDLSPGEWRELATAQ